MKFIIPFLSIVLTVSVPTADISAKLNYGNMTYLNSVTSLATRSPEQTLVVSSSWMFFSWGDKVLTSSFSVISVTPFLLTVTDAFCAGDSFNISTNGVFDFMTPSVPIVPCGTLYAITAAIAVLDPRFSHGYKFYPAGTYLFDVTTRDDPFSGGGAFISAFSLRSCRLGSQQFIIFKLPVYHKDAANACSEWGYTTAQLNPSNWQAAVNMMQGCLGSFTNAWIGSWNTDSYNGASITLATGVSVNPQGSVVVVDDGLQFPTICQRPDPNAPLIGIELLPDEV